MKKLLPFLEGIISAFVISTHVPKLPYYTYHANTSLSKNNDITQDWQMVGMDISNTTQKVREKIKMVHYEPKTT